MKIFTTAKSQLDFYNHLSASSCQPYMKKKNGPEFDFYLEEFLNEESKDMEEYSILLPKHGRFWDNGYEDVE